MSGKGLSVGYEIKSDLRSVEQSVVEVADNIKRGNRSPVARSIQREVERIERNKTRKENTHVQ
jgi:hypothetical protein